MTSFRYNALPDSKTWIRILTLESGKADEPLNATLTHEFLETTSVYEAISYCWGSSDKSHRIKLHQNTSIQSLPITESLNLALRRFRHPLETRRLWTDAICINQEANDKTEKNDQVRLMGKIYALAHKVLIYLGEPDESTHRALMLMEQIHKAAVNAPANDQRRAMQWINENKIPRVTEPWKWEPLKTFFRRPWFRRKWIIQECVLASQLVFHCGTWEKDWEWMAVVEKTMHDKGLAVCDYTVSSTLEQAKALQKSVAQLHAIAALKQRNTRLQLMELVYRYQTSEATDPRDHLFALLGLANDADVAALDPRYEKDDTILQNCLRYAQHFFDTKGNLEVLYRAGMQGHKLLAPSWVPNWYGSHQSFHFEHAEGLWDPLRRPLFYHISHGLQRTPIVISNDAILHVKGVVFDAVRTLANRHLQDGTDPFLDKDALLLQKRKHLEESDQIMSTLKAYPTGEDLPEVYWRTLICNVTLDLQKAPDSYRQAYDAWRRFTLVSLLSTEVDRQQKEPFRKVIDGYNSDKIFGSTQAGFVAMFPQATREDDKIAMIYGGEFPFVLRKFKGKGNANYELVGQCYVHGIMEVGHLDIKSLQFEEHDILLGGDYHSA